MSDIINIDEQIKMHNNAIIDKVNNATKALLEEIKEGERQTMRDVVDKVVAITGVPISQAAGLVNLYVHNYPGFRVEKGMKGGIYRGEKQLRVDKRERCQSCGQVLRKSSKSDDAKQTSDTEIIDID